MHIPNGTSATPADDLAAAVAAMLDQVQPAVVQVRNGERGIGAGVIWRAEGVVLTNHHVIAGAGNALAVQARDGRTLAAHVVASNPTLDLALLEVDAALLAGLPVARAGDSSQVRVGDLVFAVGHPWGQRDTVTAGIVSGWGRAQVPDMPDPVPMLLSDVLLGPGNSGGPLVRSDGAVIGINSMIQGGDLSVAIPSYVASMWVAQQEQPV